MENNVCVYCGQVMMVDKECDCEEAKKARKILDHIERANNAVEELFGERCTIQGYAPISSNGMEFLFYSIEQIAYAKIHAASFVLPGGVKVKLTRGTKGAIKVERIETKKAVKTVEENL